LSILDNSELTRRVLQLEEELAYLTKRVGWLEKARMEARKSKSQKE